MKEITRIHIAKTAYDIEITAKQRLEAYIDSLQAHTGDEELMNDVEIRMTELLAENGVKEGGVISEHDVTKLRSQLGEPKEFINEEDGIEITDDGGKPTHRLYRDLDTALLGGVLGGVAAYFRINPLWTRIVFIVLSVVSAGLSLLVYAVLWLVIPAAKSAAEKLNMAGRPVTLTSIRELNESGPHVDVEKRVRVQKRVATITLGSLVLLGALCTVIFALLFLGIGSAHVNVNQIPEMYRLPFATGLASGALLVALLILVAVASFAQKFNKRIWISGIVIIVLGLSFFAITLVMAYDAHNKENQIILENTTEKTIATPEAFGSAKTLKIDAKDNASVTYVATDGGKPYMKQQSFKDSKPARMTYENGTATLSVESQPATAYSYPNNVTVYGPKLDKLIVSNGSVTYQTSDQSSLAAEIYNGSYLDLNGSIGTVDERTDGTAQFSSLNAAIGKVTSRIDGQSSVTLGNINSLEVKTQEVCASYAKANLSIANVNEGTYILNGTILPIESQEKPCITVTVAQGDTLSSYGN
jgi:phage shock protein PspC (stress-responsive transcriptional regulator)